MVVATFKRLKNVSSDLQGYVLAVKVDGLVFAACLTAEDVSFLFIKIASVLFIHSTHDSFMRLLLGRLVQCLHAPPVCPRLHDSRQLVLFLFSGAYSFGQGRQRCRHVTLGSEARVGT